MAAKKTKSVTAPVTETAPAAVPEVPATTETVAPVAEKDTFVTVLEKLVAFSADLKEVISQVKVLQKEHVKLVKSSSKKTKKTSAGAQRTLSGFAKPSLLSDELCSFMGVTKGTSMARTEVTRMINEYIKKNNLQDSSDKRHIIPDEKLKKILNLGADDKLTYFNLQKYMKHHFTKESA